MVYVYDVYVYVYVYVYAYVYVYVCMCMCMCMYVCVYDVYGHVYVYVYSMSVFMYIAGPRTVLMYMYVHTYNLPILPHGTELMVEVRGLLEDVDIERGSFSPGRPFGTTTTTPTIAIPTAAAAAHLVGVAPVISGWNAVSTESRERRRRRRLMNALCFTSRTD